MRKPLKPLKNHVWWPSRSQQKCGAARVHNFGIAVSRLRGPFTCPHQELQAECEGISCKCMTVNDSCAAPKFAQRGSDNYSGSRLPGPISLEASTVGAHVFRRSTRCDQRLLPVRKQNAKLLRTSQFSSAVHRGPFLRVGYSSEIKVIISQKLISFQAYLRSSKEARSLTLSSRIMVRSSCFIPEGNALAWVNESIGLDNHHQPYWPTVVVEHR
jgi:hypothetical protein